MKGYHESFVRMLFGLLVGSLLLCADTYAKTTIIQGVGHEATDRGKWSLKQAGNDGQLYVCNDFNTSVLYYTPHTYPHLLRVTDPVPTPTTAVTIKGWSLQ